MAIGFRFSVHSSVLDGSALKSYSNSGVRIPNNLLRNHMLVDLKAQVEEMHTRLLELGDYLWPVWKTERINWTRRSNRRSRFLEQHPTGTRCQPAYLCPTRRTQYIRRTQPKNWRHTDLAWTRQRRKRPESTDRNCRWIRERSESPWADGTPVNVDWRLWWE